MKFLHLKGIKIFEISDVPFKGFLATDFLATFTLFSFVIPLRNRVTDIFYHFYIFAFISQWKHTDITISYDGIWYCDFIVHNSNDLLKSLYAGLAVYINIKTTFVNVSVLNTQMRKLRIFNMFCIQDFIRVQEVQRR